VFADNESQLAHLLRRLSFGALPRLAVNKVVTVRGTGFTRTQQEVVERSEVEQERVHECCPPIKATLRLINGVQHFGHVAEMEGDLADDRSRWLRRAIGLPVRLTRTRSLISAARLTEISGPNPPLPDIRTANPTHHSKRGRSFLYPPNCCCAISCT